MKAQRRRSIAAPSKNTTGACQERDHDNEAIDATKKHKRHKSKAGVFGSFVLYVLFCGADNSHARPESVRQLSSTSSRAVIRWSTGQVVRRVHFRPHHLRLTATRSSQL